MTATMPPPMLEVSDIAMRFGEVTALDGVSLAIRPGECIGLVGHNGAGKSTIVSVMNGLLSPQAGRVTVDAQTVASYGASQARASGIRCVFQELSLCPNLTVAENARIAHGSFGGWNWRKAARQVVKAKLDEIFPGHGMDCSARVGDLSIAQRQMVEIAMAFATGKAPPRLVVLDEPTSSLDSGLAAQLLAHVRSFVASGGAVILISHILDEILSTATRIVVMKDGKIVADRPGSDFTLAGLVEVMGSSASAFEGRRPPETRAQIVLSHRSTAGVAFHASRGEIVGLAGLAGHGQTAMLLSLHDSHAPQWFPPADPAIAFVAGDRRHNGIFELWSILRNITAAGLSDLARLGVLSGEAENRRGEDWRQKIGIRTPSTGNSILSLSGGNQQKVLFARALSTRAPVVLMDDPMRGVDIGTKREVYRIIRSEAEAGRTFVWYSTEMEEMQFCDRVYVFREGSIVAELSGDDITEKAILAASFRGSDEMEAA